MVIKGLVGRRSRVVLLLICFLTSSGSANIFSIFKKKASEPLEIKVIAHVMEFHDLARQQPEEAFYQYAGDKAQPLFGPLGRVLCPISDPSAGWAYFFETSVNAISFISDKTALALFYHPWSDVALITAWTCTKKHIHITDTELFMGDVLRQQGDPPYDIDPHWLRSSLAPYLAASLSSAQTVTDFQRIFTRDNRKLKKGWRAVISLDELMAVNHEALGFMFQENLADLTGFLQDPDREVLRDQSMQVLQQLQQGQVEQLVALAPETQAESRAILENQGALWGQAKVATFVKKRDPQGREHSFVLYSLEGVPEYLMSFWFQKEKGSESPNLRRIDFVDQNKALTHFDQINTLL